MIGSPRTWWDVLVCPLDVPSSHVWKLNIDKEPKFWETVLMDPWSMVSNLHKSDKCVKLSDVKQIKIYTYKNRIKNKG
jgi:hypothetical protein